MPLTDTKLIVPTVINAVSYTMYASSLQWQFASHEQRDRIEARVAKLYNFIRRRQRSDGSWFYSPDGRSFIDCFHSCIVLKNIVKAGRILTLPDSASIVAAGYNYLQKSFWDQGKRPGEGQAGPFLDACTVTVEPSPPVRGSCRG